MKIAKKATHSKYFAKFTNYLCSIGTARMLGRGFYNIGRTMSRNLLATVSISILAGQAPLLIKPIIAGKILGGKALAAISLTAPVLELCYAVIFLLVLGTSYLITEYVSVNDITSVRKHFTVSAISTLAVISLLSIALLVSTDSLSVILGGGDSVLTGLIKEYMHIIALSFIPLGLFCIYMYMFQATGQLRLVISSSLAISITNVVLSLLFATVFHMGIAGFAWPFFISTLLGSFIVIIAATKHPYFHLTDVRHDFFHYLRINVRKGFPLMIDDLLCIIMFFACNIIIVDKIGGNGPIIWGIACYFITFAAIMMNIISDATLILGFEMRSTGDYRSCHQMIKRYRFIINIVIVSVLAIVEIFPGAVMSLFGEPGMATPDTCNHLRMAVSIMAVMSIVMFEATNYYLIDKSGTYLFLTSLIHLGPVLVLLLFNAFSASCSWWAFLVSAAASLLGATFVSKDVGKCIRSQYRDTPSMDKSVPYDFSAIGPVLDSADSFLRTQAVAPESVNAAIHCIDELSYNIIKHAPQKYNKRTFDIRAAKVDDDIIILFKYGGKPFNPIMNFEGSAADAIEKGDKLQLALRVFNHYAISPWYHYGYGINALAMKLSLSDGIQKNNI